MPRTLLLVLDSFGLGYTDDAALFGDTGANTFGRILKHFERSGGLTIPNLLKMGLGHAALESAKTTLPGLDHLPTPMASYGFAAEKSKGKDTPSGHWEMAGLPVEFDWGYFPNTIPCFPSEFMDQFKQASRLEGTLGHCHASGTEIIKQLGQDHIRSGFPICYTSADSVFQIAAHEDRFGLDRLYEICEIAEDLLKPWNIGRVIARPFIGDSPETFQRTSHRRDYTVPPHGPTLLDHMISAGQEVISIGKISDIFAHRGISRSIKAAGNMTLFDETLAALKTSKGNSLIFTNFVDFDMLYGHRRDIEGYGRALEAFDQRLPELLEALSDNDQLILTADHGCDPGWEGSDHTREHVPVIIYRPNQDARNLGKRDSFADIGQTIAFHQGIKALSYGKACI